MSLVTYKNLPCDLTNEEVAAYSNELAKITSMQAEIEAEKKEVLSDFTAKLNKCLADARVLARKITTRKEDRSIECEQEYDYSKGMVYTVRTDTGVTIDQRKMRDDERQDRLNFEKKEDARQEKEDHEESRLTVCQNPACPNFDKGEPNGCKSLEHVYECERATGEATGHSLCERCHTSSGCEKCCETCKEQCNASQICLVKEAEEEKKQAEDAENQRRDSICDEWRECSYKDKCFTPENEEAGICLKEQDARQTTTAVAEPGKDGITPDKIETIQVPLKAKSLKNYRAQVSVACGETGAWYVGFHLHTPNGGGGHAPYPKFSEQHPSRMDAIKKGCEILYNEAMDYVKDEKVTRLIAIELSDFLVGVK